MVLKNVKEPRGWRGTHLRWVGFSVRDLALDLAVGNHVQSLHRDRLPVILALKIPERILSGVEATMI
jgi:hypothetical protein